MSIISRPEVFFNKDVPENLADFVGKHICRNLFSNRPATFWKKKTPAQYFSYEFCEIFKSILFTEHFRTTASEYRNICQEFRPKCEKNESNDILVTYFHILMASTCMWMNIHQFIKLHQHVQNSRPEVFCKKGVPRSFTKFTEKHLCQSLFFNKVY